MGWSSRAELPMISFAAWPRTQRNPWLSGLSGSPLTDSTRPSSISTSIPQSVGWQFIGHIVRTTVLIGSSDRALTKTAGSAQTTLQLLLLEGGALARGLATISLGHGGLLSASRVPQGYDTVELRCTDLRR